MESISIGHNSANADIKVEVRLFNSLSRFGGSDGVRRHLILPAGSSIGDILGRLRIPHCEVFLALRNGRDVTPSLYSGLNTERIVDQGDIIAFSGPVPYSWGYGSPVV